MPNNILPTVGSRGAYTLITPFNAMVVTNELLTCKAIRSISELIAAGVDVYKEYYQANGLTQVDFDNAVKNDEFIISFQGGTGVWIYVPSNYLGAAPITAGIPYHVRVVGVSLGAVPVNKDITVLKQAIANLVYDTIGIQPEVKELEVSGVSLVDNMVSANIETMRSHRVVNNQSDSGRYLTTLNDYNNALIKIAALEAFIMNNRAVLGI